MPHPRLRVFYGSEENLDSMATAPAAPARSMVSVPLGEILPALAEAVRTRRAWVRDFDEDQVTISNDLYQVVRAFQRLRRPSA